MSAFIQNFVTGKYHPDDRVNAVIRKGKNGSYDIYEMIDHLELLVGCKGAWKTQEIISEYKKNSITFDQFVNKYLELPNKVIPSEEQQQTLVAKRNKLWIDQAEAYEDDQKVNRTEDELKLVKRLIQRHIFRDCIFTNDTKKNFERPNFVILEDKDREDASQSSTIADILFKHLNKAESSVEDKVHWWKTYNGEIYSHFSTLRSQVVRIMFTNFIQLFEKERKQNTPSENEYGGTTSVLTSSQETFIETPLNLLIQVCEQDRALLADEVLDPNIDKDAYNAFLEVCASAYFPKDKFKAHMRTNALSKVLTETEEAFALLSLENNFDRWLWCAEKGTKPENSDTMKGLPKLRYQENPTQRKDNRINAGQWTAAGKKRMNELLEKVAISRMDRMDFEKTLKQMYHAGCSAEEVTSGWIRSTNSLKRKRRENVPVKNCLSITKHTAV